MDEFTELEQAWATLEGSESDRVRRRVVLRLAREVWRQRKVSSLVDALTVAGWAAAPENPVLPRAARRRQRAELERLGLSRAFIERAYVEARAH